MRGAAVGLGLHAGAPYGAVSVSAAMFAIVAVTWCVVNTTLYAVCLPVCKLGAACAFVLRATRRIVWIYRWVQQMLGYHLDRAAGVTEHHPQFSLTIFAVVPGSCWFC